MYEVEMSYTVFCHTQKGSIAAGSGTAYASRISSETGSGLNMHSLKVRLRGTKEIVPEA